MKVLEQECITPAKGRIQLVATGYIWFNYKTKACNTFSLRLVTFSFALTCRGHLSLTPKEANILNVGTIYFMRSTSLLISGIVTDTVKIEDVLKNETDRSAWIDFNGYMNTTWRYDYFDECKLLARTTPVQWAATNPPPQQVGGTSNCSRFNRTINCSQFLHIA